MKKTKSTILFILALAISSFVASACSTNRVNLADNRTVSLERVHSDNITVSRVYVYQDGDQLEISGRVKRRSSSIFNGGHVDIAIISPDGEILEQVSTRYYPRIIRRRGARESFFTARLTAIPPKGSIVRVAYHEAVKSGNGVFDCGQNAAVQKR